jgi:hypothetical protein
MNGPKRLVRVESALPQTADIVRRVWQVSWRGWDRGPGGGLAQLLHDAAAEPLGDAAHAPPGPPALLELADGVPAEVVAAAIGVELDALGHAIIASLCTLSVRPRLCRRTTRLIAWVSLVMAPCFHRAEI